MTDRIERSPKILLETLEWLVIEGNRQIIVRIS